MTEGPILMTPMMVRPTRVGLKWLTRRLRDLVVVNGCPDAWELVGHVGTNTRGQRRYRFENTEATGVNLLLGEHLDIACPYGDVGTRLWVRENWTYLDDARGGRTVAYQADFTDEQLKEMRMTTKWRPSIHLPRTLSRLLLEITDIKVERLHTITEEDAQAEGVTPELVDEGQETERYSYVAGFRSIWLKLHGLPSWERNPYVWCIYFKLVNS